MNQEAGIRLSLQEDVSSTARRTADELNQIARSADTINQALDPKVLDDYNRKLTEIGQNYSRVQAQQRGQAIGVQRAMTTVGGAVTTGVTQTMQSGDVVGGAISGAKGLSGLLAGLGPIGAAVGLTAAGLGVANMGANYYFGRSEPARRLAGMQGQYGFDIAENSQRLRDTMNRVIDQVSEYGVTYEEGTRAVEGFLRAGGTNFTSTRAAQYSAAYGVDINQAMAMEGLGQRFGQARGLQSTRALVRGQGLAPAMFGEMMQGIQDSFSQTLSMGIVRGFDEIARSQMYFAGAGETWTGALGQQRVAQLNQAARGAVGLGAETDVFMYRAASDIARAQGGGGLIDAYKILERGMTPELYKGVRGQLQQYGYGREQSIRMMSRMFGLSTTAAEQLYGMQDVDQSEFERLMAGDLGAEVGKTTETEYIRSVEGIKQTVGNIGATLFDTKQNIVEIGEKIVEYLEKSLEGDGEMPIEYAGITVENATIAIKPPTAGAIGGGFADMMQYGAVMGKRSQAQAMGIDSSLIEAIFQAAYAPGSAGGGMVTRDEGAAILEKLTELIDAVREPMVVDTPTAEEDPSTRYRGW